MLRKSNKDSLFSFVSFIIIIVGSNYFLLLVKSAELFTLTYGAIVMQLLADYDTVEEVNEQLDKM